jgi:hypothetical protein
MKKLIAVLLLAVAGFAAFIGSPLFRAETENVGAWQILRYTMGVDSLEGTALFAADADGDGIITLNDALLLALTGG